MIGLVVVTHGALATEFVAALEHVVGRQKQLAAICIDANDDLDVRRRDIREAVEDVGSGDGVIILTDMFGGTPSNLALDLLSRGKVEVLAGINLPMLIKLAEARNREDLATACKTATEAGCKYIAIASEVLGRRP